MEPLLPPLSSTEPEQPLHLRGTPLLDSVRISRRLWNGKVMAEEQSDAMICMHPLSDEYPHETTKKGSQFTKERGSGGPKIHSVVEVNLNGLYY